MSLALASAAQRARFLAAQPHWRYEQRHAALHSRLQFADFVEAMAFINQVATVAEQLGHHPEWRNIYNTVWLSLTTHDAGGVTELDFQLAAEIERCASHWQPIR